MAGLGGAATVGGAGAASGAGAGLGGAGLGGTELGGVGNAGAPPCVTPVATTSALIPTVETVTFTTTLANLTHAEIEFGPAAGGSPMVAPVDLTSPGYRTHLLGMKPSASYVYRVKVTSAAGSCVSDDQPITTGALPSTPDVTVTILDPERHERGFTLLNSGIGLKEAYIVDPDGEVVWVAPVDAVPLGPVRTHLSWDGTRYIAMSSNYSNTDSGAIQSMAMDGSDVRSVEGVSRAHHDFVSIPGGVAAIVWIGDGPNAPSSLVEFFDAGGSRTVVADLTTAFGEEGPFFHTNSVHYYDADRSYTVGDRGGSLYVKVSAEGQLLWQFGGAQPLDPNKTFAGVESWAVSHGHHLTADGTFVFFNNTFDVPSRPAHAIVYRLDTLAMEATKLATFDVPWSKVLGDVQRLANGNFLVTSSDSATISELTPDGTLVMTLHGGPFGYTEFRSSLYGPPPY